jgi:hypothetical protein
LDVKNELHESRAFTDGTARLIDEEVQRILREAQDRAYQLLADHRDQLELLTTALMEREELDRDDGQRKGSRAGFGRKGVGRDSCRGWSKSLTADPPG